MADYFEVDFLSIEAKKSGDAITLRYKIGEVERVHVVDGGYIDTGDQIIEHLKTHYGTTHIEHMVLTHSDQDHANGLRAVLENCSVGNLWMNRPWIYASALIDRFATYNSVDALERKLRDLYSTAAELEEIATRKKIPIHAPFQGATIGAFLVVAPTFSRYCDLIVDSERTPEAAKDHSLEATLEHLLDSARTVIKAVKNLVKAAWGEEYFPTSPTSRENEMSVVQTALLNGRRILLTGDAGREALQEAIDYMRTMGIALPGIHNFQVPHHGGRHNVSSEVLDQLLGPKHQALPEKTEWSAVCSAAKEDEDHPKLSVKRAIMHRGGHWAETDGKAVNWAKGIARAGWSAIPQAAYPEEQEEA